MKIAPALSTQYNSKNNTSFKAISFVNYNSDYSSRRTELQREVEKFAQSKSNVSELGAGKFGETYKFKTPNLRDIVIKCSKKGYKDDYALEYDNLVQVPTNKIGGQAGVARAYNTATKEYYLLSTLTEGKEISQFNRYKESHLQSLFKKMFELDKVGFYHGDLNGKNILLTKNGEINFIDYQWSQSVPKANFFDDVKSKKLLLPNSHFPENAQMFEMATMPYYMEKIGTQSEKESFLKMYLKNKATYHQKRYDYIKQITANWPYSSELPLIRQSLTAENAKAKIYRNPSEKVLKLELKKLQFLSDYRDAFGHVDPNMLDRNILTSSSSYLCSVSAVQDFRKEIHNQLMYCADADMKAYLKSQAEYGEYWYKNLVEYSSDTFDYVMRAITKNLNYDETKHNFYIDDRNPRIMKGNKDILSAMNSKFHTTYESNFSTPYGIKETMHEIFSEPMSAIKKEAGSNLKAYHRRKKVQHAYKELKDFSRQGKVLDLLNTAELITLKTREFYGYTYNNMKSWKLDSLLNNMTEAAANFTEHLHSTILENLKELNPRYITVQGYKKMGKFVTKI